MSSQLSPSNLTGRRRSSSSAVVALPSRRAGELNGEFLARVDERMSEVVDDLERVWSDELAPTGSPVDILTDHDLPDLLRGLIGTGGKRIRPSMCLWGWVVAGGRRNDRGAAEVLQVATALELLHVFALIHDDVMDESASRRGQPSVHTLAAQLHLHSGSRGSATRFGDNIAVLVGDLAHAEADHLVSALPAAMRAIWRVLVIELVRGQSRDLTGSAAGRRDLAHARQVAQMKSGCYTVWRPLQLGAAAADADPATLEVLATYGSEVGEAFALRDDLLGVWGDPARTGKPAGDDLLSGKPTVIISLAHELLHGPARQVLERVGTPALSPADVTFLQDALRAGGVVDAVESRISAHVHAAVAALDAEGLDPQGVAGLTQMAHRIAWRDR
ncbi:MAG: Geranylgeranyl diphosphate synthase [uncultured Friedmanniella sp.]|uniref:Geranylgeranyl diphosphate synthase n=1 Tax=uncultured Friedmanniella sp. TaxID=335381 RepID=A0A6J4KV05_9ACTN|nr:MAG: Geranylgeranyl diphosphate synthase [uncultured Friedmanniella sp.]